MVKVRRGKVEDIPHILPLFRQFCDTSGFTAAGIKFSSAAVAALLTRSLADRGIVTVADGEDGIVGYALAAVVPFPFNPKATVVSELSVYAADPKTKALLSKKVRQVGSQLGATAVCSADLQLGELK
jgi:L-amino acid N-acyltransferase YncA